MRSRKPARIIPWAVIVIGLCIGGYLLYDRGRPAPVPIKEKLFEGVTYRRVVRLTPHPMIVHILVIDTKTEGISFLITPADSKGDLPLNARTTSQFLEEFGIQIAVNGNGFTPWWSHNPADYYPHEGDPVMPNGLAASTGDVYSKGVQRSIGIAPTLYISRRNALSFNNRPGNVYNAISGDRMLVEKGEVMEGLDDSAVEPRTAVGLNKNGRYLILIVVDGRQPFYSDGATFVELAGLMIEQDANIAMSLDGGGSSTMVIEGRSGEPEILNSPIDNYIPGRERPVANHLGIYLK